MAYDLEFRGAALEAPGVGPAPGGIDQPRIRRAVREILAAIGEDPDREGLLDTPARVARAWAEICGGLHEDVSAHLARTFDHEGGGCVLLSGIDFHSLCEHHLLPFSGKAHVAYLPSGGKVVGLSKLARCVEVYARRPQLQERLSEQIADALVEHLGADGVLVHVEAEHLCMKMRGVRKLDALMKTTALRGRFAEDRELRQEIMNQIHAHTGSAPVFESVRLPARSRGESVESAAANEHAGPEADLFPHVRTTQEK